MLNCEYIKLSGDVIFQQHSVVCQSHQLHHDIAMCSVIHTVSYETSLYQSIAQQASELTVHHLIQYTNSSTAFCSINTK